MTKKIMLLTALVFMILSQKNTQYAQKAIDTSGIEGGTFKVSYTCNEDGVYRVMVVKGEERVVYPLPADGSPHHFPLQLGNGTYTLSLLRRAENNRFVFLERTTVDLNLKDPMVVYLQPIQIINWRPEKTAIQFGGELLKSQETPTKQTHKLYEYIVENIAYDYDKIPKLTAEYIPSIESTFIDQKGICYDYSALLAGILRSQNVPTRLVKGYTSYVDGYHAWNEVYLDGQWKIIDSTVDAAFISRLKSIFKAKESYQTIHFY